MAFTSANNSTIKRFVISFTNVTCKVYKDINLIDYYSIEKIFLFDWNTDCFDPEYVSSSLILYVYACVINAFPFLLIFFFNKKIIDFV